MLLFEKIVILQFNIYKDATIMKAKETLFNHHPLLVFVCLFSITMGSMILLPCLEIGIIHAEPRISAASNNEPLYHLLAKISSATGYSIEITKGWKDKLITTELKKVTLEEGMKTIIWAMGRPNYVMIVDDSRKKIEIRIIEASSTGLKDARGADVVTKHDFHDRRNPSPELEKAPGMSPAEREGQMETGRQQPQRPELGIELPY